MGLLSFFKKSDDSSGSAAAAPDAVAQARSRARRRLIGATVLLGIGVIGFPLLFETQPRPIPVDIPIEIPRKDNAPPLVLPPARPASAASAMAPLEPVAAAVAARPASARAMISERAAEQGRELPATPVASHPPPAPAASHPSAAQAASRSMPIAALPASRPPSTPAADDGARAQALLDDKPPARVPEAGPARIVVQVGAYVDTEKLREARQRVEKLGMKTYTQVVETDAGRRTRVRVGPFGTRAEAEKVAARIRAAGLPVAILAL